MTPRIVNTPIRLASPNPGRRSPCVANPVSPSSWRLPSPRRRSSRKRSRRRGIPGSPARLGPATRDTTGVGQTKPPGAALGPDAGLTPELQQRDREIQRRIDTGICDGCTE
ncbi:hypothetical protein ABZT49_10320 [Methylobacterium sp. EM32]|uniref:hypothetical protein n=1 Tax=Methylobacterium sp. EM32 TaxID=3163481 RepID=UPI0033B98B87